MKAGDHVRPTPARIAMGQRNAIRNKHPVDEHTLGLVLKSPVNGEAKRFLILRLDTFTKYVVTVENWEVVDEI